jgi:riboflavin kinase/FMN adenylyltransferase
MPDGTIVSSSAIRAAVAAGDLDRAADLLGRPPALFGKVVRGEQRGRVLGFPTANLDLGGELRPLRGVYGAWTELEGRRFPAVVNIGGRPTFHPEGTVADAVEIHIPGWSGDLYGRMLEAFLLGRIREERKFDGAEALRAQIARDVETLGDHVRSGRWRV